VPTITVGDFELRPPIKHGKVLGFRNVGNGSCHTVHTYKYLLFVLWNNREIVESSTGKNEGLVTLQGDHEFVVKSSSANLNIYRICLQRELQSSAYTMQARNVFAFFEIECSNKIVTIGCKHINIPNKISKMSL
jgi:hypothetical protein